MNAEEKLLVDAVRDVSGGEWIEAEAVWRYLRRELPGRPPVDVSRQQVARRLPALAAAGHFDVSQQDGSKHYRAQVEAIEVYGADGTQVGRLLLWRAAEGMILDATQLVEALPAIGWRIHLGDRDVRRVRKACDDALWHLGRLRPR